MAGQAAVTVNSNQWNVWVASTYAELTNGLRGRASIPSGTGMLFMLPSKQAVSVDTSGMEFPIDIIFISENAVIDVASNIQPDYLVTEETPCDMFLEINASEAAGVEVGDAVDVEPLYTIVGGDLTQIMSFAIPLAALGFVCSMAGGMAQVMAGSPSSPTQLVESPHFPKGQIIIIKPEARHIYLGKATATVTADDPKYRQVWTEEIPSAVAYKDIAGVTVECPLCEKAIEIGEYDSISRSDALKKHLEAEHPHHSMWLNPEQRKELEKKYGAVAVRWAEEATRPGDIKGAEAAAEYYYGKIKGVLGLGHLSPELSEQQIRKLRELLGLPADVAEVLKIHRETGYIP